VIPKQLDLTNDELRDLLAPYLSSYPIAIDTTLSELVGKRCFDRKDVEAIVDWKFQDNRHRRVRTRNLLSQNSDLDIEDLTSRAFRCSDDLGALLLVMELIGVGKALGSAILTAYDPSRFTVYDFRAGRAAQALGYLRDLPTPSSEGDELPWIRFLGAVRDLAARAEWTLRNVDRALWEAGK
jgi:hypothetical protein